MAPGLGQARGEISRGQASGAARELLDGSENEPAHHRERPEGEQQGREKEPREEALHQLAGFDGRPEPVPAGAPEVSVGIEDGHGRALASLDSTGGADRLRELLESVAAVERCGPSRQTQRIQEHAERLDLPVRMDQILVDDDRVGEELPLR